MTNLESPEWRRRALQCALAKAPKTTWEPGPIYDYSEQRLSLSTMRDFFECQAYESRGELLSAPAQWATTGRWPRLPQTGKFFLRLTIQEAIWRSSGGEPQDSIRGRFRAPPWTADEASWLGDATTVVWYTSFVVGWIDEQAKDHFDSQEHTDRMWRPYD